MGATTMPNTSVRRASAHIGMMLCLASFAMLFITLLFSYGIIRSKSAVWPPLGTPALPVALAWLNTGVLLASSLTLGLGERQLARGNQAAYVRGLAFTLGLGLLFLGLQMSLWQRVHADGLTLDATLFGSWLYMLTAVHAVHIVAGLGILVALLPGAVTHRLYPEALTRARLSGMFWHFLGVTWVTIFVALFLI